MYLTNSVKYITLYIVIYKPMSMVVIIAFLKKLPLSVGRTIALYAEGSVSIPGRDRLKSLKQVLSATKRSATGVCYGSSEMTI